jgi:predicted RNA-binding protein with PIN domain
MSSQELQQLIDMAKRVTVTRSDLDQQSRSFAYGNTRIENTEITWETVEKAASTLQSDPESPINERFRT